MSKRPPNENVCELFWKFSVFERDLKAKGFLKGPEDRVAVDWKTFGNKIDGLFNLVTTPGFEEACCKLKAKPPRVQVVSEKRLGWKDPEQQGDQPLELYVLKLIKTIRNNLFHGGKYPDGPVEDIERDSELIDSALVVLAGFSQILERVGKNI